MVEKVTIPTAKLTSELVRDKNVNEDFLLDSLSGKENKPRQENLDEEITAPDPFEILLQFDAHDDRISVLLYDNMRKLFTCGDSDYLVKEWEIPRLAPAGRQVRRSSVTETVNCLRILIALASKSAGGSTTSEHAPLNIRAR